MMNRQTDNTPTRWSYLYWYTEGDNAREQWTCHHDTMVWYIGNETASQLSIFIGIMFEYRINTLQPPSLEILG